ncbi:nucleotidyltransferase domain-containing protein [Flavobacterium zepuense]|uniref:Nucleotidyltransferase domain-containing protein n=1 Tax=Flavobacterium zepuense TaxID=2593302 RepID=A0A552UYL8_9FLAO|nr:nucleotidyltransferase domain-containing protein [Flavobacterium zepuense]TRW23333.1 nucleotidyltransferase domain-containing protein [Flavobacterium zepuense]
MKLIEEHIDSLKSLCYTHNVDRMYLFGSAVTSNFNDKSDIDFLVKFKAIDLAVYFDNYINFKTKLKNLFGREVDLIEEQTLKNPILINSINKSKELVYG